jgi:hypothetical protein
MIHHPPLPEAEVNPGSPSAPPIRSSNVGRVVLNGNPVTGWTLVDWDGITTFSIDEAA